jgi:hypothetical protein
MNPLELPQIHLLNVRSVAIVEYYHIGKKETWTILPFQMNCVLKFLELLSKLFSLNMLADRQNGIRSDSLS